MRRGHPSRRRYLCPARHRLRVGPRVEVPPCCRTTRLLRRPQSLGCHWRTARARSPRRPHPPRPPSPQSRNAAPAARRLRSKSMEILVSRSRLAGTPPHYVYRVLVPVDGVAAERRALGGVSVAPRVAGRIACVRVAPVEAPEPGRASWRERGGQTV